MEYRKLGRSGLEVSVVGLGCNNFGMRLDQAGTTAVVNSALDNGINLFDTADVYGGQGTSETFLGEALKGRRDEAIVATKFGMPMGEGPHTSGGSRKHIMQSVEASLKRLQTDYIDLYQIHRFDDGTPLDETMRALDDVVRAGKVRYIGCSNFSGWQVAHADWTARSANLTPFVSLQNHWSLLQREIEADAEPAAAQFGLGILPYFPLASGLLTGKYRKGEPFPEGTRLAAWGERAKQMFATDRNVDHAEALRTFAEDRGHTLLEIAFSWLASWKTVSSVIAGATKPEQIEANVAAVSWPLSEEERAEVDKILRD